MAASLSDGVLSALLGAEGKPLSGQNLAGRLGVTRAAVWKCVEGLRGQGYLVESIPARGYRLDSGLGLPRFGEAAGRLTTARFGRELKHFTLTDSTNREATRWAEAGAPEGATVTAESQSAGRGRLGRGWFAKPGKNLLASIVCRPTLPTSVLPQITFVTALSLAKALSRWIGRERLSIKWPNDVLADGKKIAGILMESRIEGARADYVVVGVGLNVLGTVADYPEELRDTATTVEANTGANGVPSVLDALLAFLEEFERHYDRFLAGGFEALKDDFDGWFGMKGRRVSVSGAGSRLVGVVEELGVDGALVLRLDDGSIRRIHAGDIEFATTRAGRAA